MRSGTFVAAGALAAVVALPGSAHARGDWEHDEFPRVSTTMEFAGYGGHASASAGDGSLLVGGRVEICVICTWSMDKRLAWGDWQSLDFGLGGGLIREGFQFGWGIDRDLDVSLRGGMQYGGYAGVGETAGVIGAAARYSRYTAGLSVGVAGATFVGFDARAMLTEMFELHGFVEYGKQKDGTRESGTALRLAAGITF